MNSADRGRVAGPLLALVSGLLLAAAFPPLDAGPLAFIALCPLLMAIDQAPPAVAARRGFLCGVAFFAPLLIWLVGVISRYGGLSPALAYLILALLVAYLAGYFALFAALAGAASRRWGRRGWMLAPIFWVALEILRGHLLTGFPWGLAGYTQWRNPALLRASSWGGVYLVSALVVMVNVAVVLLLRPGPRRAPRLAAGLVLLALAGSSHIFGPPVPGAGAPDAADPGAFRVAAVQANVSQDEKWRPGEEEAIVARLLAMTESAGRGGARLVVWPESSSPVSFRRPVRVPGTDVIAVEPRGDFQERVGEMVRHGGLTLIAGSVDYRHEAGRLSAYNSALVISPDGRPGASYDKTHLVPFGEYVPLAGVLFFVDRMVQGAIAEFAPGRRMEPLPTPGGAAATFVCYEAIFPELVRRLAERSEFLVNITNDAWFGRSGAPRQHLAMAVFRAAENRRWLLRAANTGISALVDPYGRVIDSTPLFETAVLIGGITPRADRTLYSRVGDTPAWGCVIVTLLSVAALRAVFFRPGR